MALFPRVTTWVSNQVLTASALNGEFNNILNNAQASSLVGFSSNVAQMQQQTSPGGVGSESLSGSISDELQRLRFMMAYTLGKTYWYDQTGSNLGTGGIQTGSLADDAVTTVKILDANVTTAKLADDAVETVKIKDANVTTPKIADGAVTQVKRAANIVTSSAGGLSSYTFSGGAGNQLTVTNLTLSITTVGKPVRLSIIADGTSNASFTRNTSASGSFNIYFYRGATQIARYQHNLPQNVTMPTSAYSMIDTPAAGTYTYTVQVQGASITIDFTNCKLVAQELA